MKRPPLKHKDGFSSTTPWMRSEVKRLQKALNQTGAVLECDGYYGNGCKAAVETFQKNNSLKVSGLADAATWEALEPHLQQVFGFTYQMISNLMPGFRGDLDWIHALEGHYGKPYWPGGASGVTLDPGVDLGHVTKEQVINFYGGTISDAQYKALDKAFGKSGEPAREVLEGDPVIQGIRISRDKADEIMPFAAKGYWKDIADRFPALKDDTAYPAVQTVLLSLSYNRGPRNKGLEELGEPIAAGDWARVGELVGNMQQNHSLEGIRKRRRWEGSLIREHLERMA